MWNGKKIFEFLAGLNIEFDQGNFAFSQCLTKETLPSLNEGFFPLIWAGKGRRIVMLDGPNSVGSPMVTTNGVHKPFSEALNVSAKNASIEGPKSSHREGVWCTLPQEATTYQRHMLETPWTTFSPLSV